MWAPSTTLPRTKWKGGAEVMIKKKLNYIVSAYAKNYFLIENIIIRCSTCHWVINRETHKRCVRASVGKAFSRLYWWCEFIENWLVTANIYNLSIHIMIKMPERRTSPPEKTTSERIKKERKQKSSSAAKYKAIERNVMQIEITKQWNAQIFLFAVSRVLCICICRSLSLPPRAPACLFSFWFFETQTKGEDFLIFFDAHNCFFSYTFSLLSEKEKYLYYFWCFFYSVPFSHSYPLLFTFFHCSPILFTFRHSSYPFLIVLISNRLETMYCRATLTDIRTALVHSNRLHYWNCFSKGVECLTVTMI